MNAPKDPTQPERSICGARFREMLKCVDETGTTACTRKINDFLACERLVFRTALAKQPSPDQRHEPRAPKPKPKPKEKGGEVETASPGAVLGRAVDKQLAACSSLADSVRRPEFFGGVWSFSRRMVADIRVTCDAVGVKAAKVAAGLRAWFSGEGD